MPASSAPASAFAPPPRSFLKGVKLGIMSAAERAGLLTALRDSEWRKRRLLILAYHGIALTDEHEWSPELYLPVSALRGRFELLRQQGYNVIPLREAVEHLRTGTLPPRSVCLTFDDGTHDFIEAGVPLLREFGFPATVYVTTYYAGKEVPVFRMATRYLLWVGREKRISGEGLTLAGTPLDLKTLDQRDEAVLKIEARVAANGGGTREEMATLERLCQRVDVDFDRFLRERRLRIMSPAEIGSLPPDLVDVQLHTHRHKVPLLKDAFVREIEDNRRALSAWRPGTPLDGFCYPSGVTDGRFLPWLSSLGIQNGVTCEAGLATRTADPLLLPRLVDSWRLTRLEFESWLTGFGSLMPKVPRRERYRPAPTLE